MNQYKYAIAFVLLSMALMFSSADAQTVRPNPCATHTCEPASKTCVVYTTGCDSGETHCVKCIDCPDPNCNRGGCLLTEHDNQCPTCDCDIPIFSKKEKY